jgi:excisionase family DNA binding protein
MLPLADRKLALVEDGLVSIPDACRFTGLSRSTLYGLMDRGELVHAKIGKNRRIPVAALKELAARSLVGAGD